MCIEKVYIFENILISKVITITCIKKYLLQLL